MISIARISNPASSDSKATVVKVTVQQMIELMKQKKVGSLIPATLSTDAAGL
jgi:hypothetical protein